MKAFIMTRGGETIGEGVEFSDGRTVVRSGVGSMVVCDDLQTAIVLHDGDGQTQFTYTEELRA